MLHHCAVYLLTAVTRQKDNFGIARTLCFCVRVVDAPDRQVFCYTLLYICVCINTVKCAYSGRRF